MSSSVVVHHVSRRLREKPREQRVIHDWGPRYILFIWIWILRINNVFIRRWTALCSAHCMDTVICAGCVENTVAIALKYLTGDHSKCQIPLRFLSYLYICKVQGEQWILYSPLEARTWYPREKLLDPCSLLPRPNSSSGVGFYGGKKNRSGGSIINGLRSNHSDRWPYQVALQLANQGLLLLPFLSVFLNF